MINLGSGGVVSQADAPRQSLFAEMHDFLGRIEGLCNHVDSTVSVICGITPTPPTQPGMVQVEPGNAVDDLHQRIQTMHRWIDQALVNLDRLNNSLF